MTWLYISLGFLTGSTVLGMIIGRILRGRFEDLPAPDTWTRLDTPVNRVVSQCKAQSQEEDR